jgi:hypothetical protein
VGYTDTQTAWRWYEETIVYFVCKMSDILKYDKTQEPWNLSPFRQPLVYLMDVSVNIIYCVL